MKPDRILFTISIIDSLYYELNDPDSWDNILIFGLIIDRSRIVLNFSRNTLVSRRLIYRTLIDEWNECKEASSLS